MSAHPPKNLVLQWDQFTLDAVKDTKTSPPVAACAMALVHTPIYDAFSVYQKKAISTGTALHFKITNEANCTRDNKQKACRYAAYRLLTDCFWLVIPAQYKNMYRDFVYQLNNIPNDTSLDIPKLQGICNLAAKLMLDCKYGDGSNSDGSLPMPLWSDFTGYKPVNTWDKVNVYTYRQPLRTEGPLGEFEMGGPGKQENLAPEPQAVKNGELKSKAKNPLIGLVVNGIANGTFYWYRVEVFYHNSSQNAVLGQLVDFVERVKIQYGEPIKNSEGNWKLHPALSSVKIQTDFVGETNSNEIAIIRKKG